MIADGNKSVSSRAVLWACVLVLVAAGIVALAMVRPRGMPSYKGRSAESWLRDVFGSMSGSRQADAIAAFREMHQPGVDFLINSLDRHDGSLHRFYVYLYPRLPAALRNHLDYPQSADSLMNAASLALLNVHDETPEHHVPRLIQLLSSANPRTRLNVSGLLSHYADNYRLNEFADYRPQLVSALSDTNEWVRVEIANTLEQYGLAGPELVPALQPALTNSNTNLQRAAQSILTRWSQLANTNGLTHNQP